MKEVLKDLEPKLLWHWFETICRIPRSSGHEKMMADMLVKFAENRQFQYKRDEVDNVLITVPSRGISASRLPLMLQAHVDIVAEKLSSSTHDFLNDSIELEIEDGWVTAKETTLGADNGIGVAIMLAVLDSTNIIHPPLECLFTTDEERGLTGAAELDPDWFDARRMINLDSEEENAITIGCAGGVDFIVSDELVRSDTAKPSFTIEVSGLLGGHSGMEIVKNRASAVKVLARAIKAVMREHEVGIVSFASGQKRNAIPRDAKSVITSDAGQESIRRIIGEVNNELLNEYSFIDDNIAIRVLSSGNSDIPFTADSSKKVINLLLALPHGVVKMMGVKKDDDKSEMEGRDFTKKEPLVETSLNMAIVSTESDKLTISFSARSPFRSAKDTVCDSVGAIAELAGCRFEVGDAYPGWMPDRSSKILAVAGKVCEDVFGSEPNVEAIHAGLECGLIGEKMPGLDMISIGPDIRDVHVPGERVNIDSVNRFWKFFLELLAQLD